MAYFLKIECESESCERPVALAGLFFYGGDKIGHIKISGVVDGAEIPLVLVSLAPNIAHRWEEHGQQIALHKLAQPAPQQEEDHDAKR